MRTLTLPLMLRLTTCLLLGLSSGLSAKANPHIAPDTIVPGRLLSFKDSLHLHVQNGQMVFLKHPLRRGETIKKLSEYYGISVTDILYYNPRIKDIHAIPAGLEVMIPIPRSQFLTADNDMTRTRWRVVPLLHTVRRGETLFRIAKMYYDTPIAVIARRNKLVNNVIVPGQVLHIGWIDVRGIPAKSRRQDQLHGKARAVNNRLREQYDERLVQNKGKVNTEKGIAIWDKNAGKQVEYNLTALHPTLPLGTVVRIYAPSFKRVVYAKIIGNIPESSPYLEEGVVLLLTSSTAKALGAVNPRLRVEVTYAP